jgi:hypothetical protein
MAGLKGFGFGFESGITGVGLPCAPVGLDFF